MIIQQSIFVIILKASTSIVCLAVRVNTEKFCQPAIRFLKVSLFLLLLILIIDSYFALFVRLCLSARECAHLMGKTLLGVGISEIGMSTNIVQITLQPVLIVFLLIGNSFIFKDTDLNQYWGTVGTFNNRNYYHKLTFFFG